MLFVFDGQQIGAMARTRDGSDFVPGSELGNVCLLFWADEARTIVAPGLPFIVWYGGDVGEGVVDGSWGMTRDRFLAFLDREKVDPNCYSLDGGHPPERYVVDRRDRRWVTYYSERGLETGLQEFATEDEALEHLLGQLVRDPTTRLRP